MVSGALERLAAWLNVESVSGNEAAFALVLEEYLSELGYSCARQTVAPNRWNLIAKATENSKLIFCTHIDTVPPHLPVTETEDRIFGRGACDTKGGILAMILAAEELRQQGHGELGFLFVVGEEVDHCGAKKAREAGLKTDHIILCEPTMTRLVDAQKGMIKLELHADGVAGHSAYPSRGHSAIHTMVDVLHRLREYAWPTDELLGPTTLNIGLLNGGVAANVFAPDADAQVLIRTVSETGALKEVIREICEPVSWSVTAANDPVFFQNPNDENFDRTTVAFNTDATYLSNVAPVWLVGPGDIEHAHRDDEHITYAQLERGVDVFRDLALKVLT